MKDIKDIIALIQEYVTLIDNVETISAHTLLSKCAILLPQIYALGLQLPEVEPESEEAETYKGASPMTALTAKIGKYDRYQEIFDPVAENEAVTGTLSDDLADIYKDLKGPLLSFNQGHEADALWQWKFNLKTHCGNHLVDALRVIHRLVNYHMNPDY